MSRTHSKRRTLRPSIVMPAFMRDWPLPLQPRQVFLKSCGLELAYQSGAQKQALLRVDVPSSTGNDSGTQLSVRVLKSSFPAAETQSLQRLVADRVHGLPGEGWRAVQRSMALLSFLEEGQASDGEPTPGATCLRDLLHGAAPPTLSEFQVFPSDLQAQLAPAAILMWLSCRDYDAAFAAWDLHGDAMAARSGLAARLCAVTMRILRGQGIEARRLLEQEVGHTNRSNAYAMSRLALELKLHGLAVHYWRRSVFLDDAHDVIGLATQALLADEMQLAVKLACHGFELPSGTDENRKAFAHILVHAGASAQAVALLQAHDSDDLQLEAARLMLYSGQADEALQCIDAVTARKGEGLEQSLLRGIAMVLGNQSRASVPLFSNILEGQSDPVEAMLWLAEAHLRAGDIDAGDAVLEQYVMEIGEHAIGRLLRGVVSMSKGWGTEHRHRAMIQDVHGPGVDYDGLSPDEEIALIWSVVDRFAGNHSAELTLKGEGENLISAREQVSARAQVVRLQHQILSRDPEEVMGDIARMEDIDPDLPYWKTYSAEIALWRGDYPRALADFEDVWEKKLPTRWMYVGVGATLIMLKRYEEGLDRFREGVKPFGYYSHGEATLAYRGEAYLDMGALDDARVDLEEALQLRPSRLGTRLVLGLLHCKEGRVDEACQVVRKVSEDAPILFWEAQKALGLSPSVQPDRAHLEAILVQCREMMRGNRSSFLLTCYGEDGTWRVMRIEQHMASMVALAKQLTYAVRENVAADLCADWLTR